jgi:hypothetical protein
MGPMVAASFRAGMQTEMRRFPFNERRAGTSTGAPGALSASDPEVNAVDMPSSSLTRTGCG